MRYASDSATHAHNPVPDCSATAVHAQRIAGRLGGGLAYAGETGTGGMLSAEWRRGNAIVRLDGGGIYARQQAQMIYGGGAIGLLLQSTGALQPYALATVGRAIDVREADWLTNIGLSLGAEQSRRSGLFGELRFDHGWQNGVRHFNMPRNRLALFAGLRFGAL